MYLAHSLVSTDDKPCLKHAHKLVLKRAKILLVTKMKNN